ncbi:MAG: CusA/CzcA family heavy metal efflux RND transporter [Haliscomenobacteraceae bacterium CHB4]|nr:CusA/CzcA family heavy metal efflux RND transporter [Haliscomenobacteraceae bacterium CHB4]
MFQKIISFSLRNKVLVGLMVLTLVVAGIYAFTRLPIDAVPDITNNQAQVLTICPTLATQEVEQYVTAPIENAVRNLPGVLELRSISRFGLSVITVVFREDMDTYRARTLLNEKLQTITDQIPAGAGKPELAPISTGLGEILHYRIEPKPGYEGRYSAMELRNIQDWIVKRQLAGIPGVVEINSFGGYLQQYEVAVTPERLRAAGVSIGEVFQALQNANENTGGAYIERNASAYFIRSEGLAKNMDDLRQIVVHTQGGIPLRVGDIADVRLGHALRYGAVTHNGEGEIVLGIVMMLKGENAAEVIRRVKARLAEIEPGLPEGIRVATFLDRENFVQRTVSTVQKNLIEGALIVVFVLVLLVGNLRAGLIIASVIPLSMLFAITIMQATGLTANLMSLGAIDFGLIVDGAVIIVEATLHFFHKYAHDKIYGVSPHLGELAGDSPKNSVQHVVLSRDEMNEGVKTSAHRIIRSSVFGVVIILIVYLPILSLEGIEGKMFKPMALTVSYALIGALLLSLTYVPVASALFLNRKINLHPTFADRLMENVRDLYIPSLKRALQLPYVVLGATLGLFALSMAVFLRLGGEFLPTLDEGDILMHGFCKPGTSLTQTIHSHELAQKVILENFPDEVDQVISKIGSAEIPTDPMAPETADNIILLKDKKEWTKTKSKTELVEMIAEKVHEVPGMAFEFTQPIKMRFDEMMTGVRSDIAVKIFGTNMDSLAVAGERVSRLVRNIQGVADLKVEQVAGLPQIAVAYDYQRLARYGLQVREVNAALRAAFAGEVAGTVFDEGRRFDLVIRLDTSRRRDLSDVQNLPLATPGGQLVPLGEVARAEFRLGAAQISRDNAQRRIVVGANVRGRDVETVIREMQPLLAAELNLPPGYFITYGGQFENLQAAKARLSVAVPVALTLIFALLYFAFNSLKESLLIYSAIPMSAIGGVFALWLRDMPFSISAGVGFIALFGVAVLNGIVLIAYFDELEKEGHESVYERILLGASVRLRPVLMTAAVASLGFLPMAISTGAGAEVQRPLATVVIGGLVTSTLLTLIVLPVLYAMFFGGKKPGARKSGDLSKVVKSLIIILLFAGTASSQKTVTEAEALKIVAGTHPALHVADARIRSATLLQTGASRSWEPAEIYHNIAADPDLGMFGTSTFGLTQAFPSGRQTRAQRMAYDRQKRVFEAERNLTERQLAREVRDIFQHLSYLEEKSARLRTLDSLYQKTAGITESRFLNGESAQDERLAARDQAARIRLELETIGHETAFDRQVLGQLLGLNEPLVPVVEPFRRREFRLADTARVREGAYARVEAARTTLAEALTAQEKARRNPVFTAGLNAQYLANGALYPGYAVGMRLPLAQKNLRARAEASAAQAEAARAQYEATVLDGQIELAHLLHEVEKYEILLEYFEKEGRALAAELRRSAFRRYEAGESDFTEWVQAADRALRMEMEYLDNLNMLNRTFMEIEMLLF